MLRSCDFTSFDCQQVWRTRLKAAPTKMIFCRFLTNQLQMKTLKGSKTMICKLMKRLLEEIQLEQAASDKELRQDVEFGWSRIDTPPTCVPFTGNPGLTVGLPDDPDEIDFFNLLFDDDMWSNLSEQTNLYAQRRIEREQMGQHSRLRKWVPTTPDEMKVFIGLIIAMELVQKPDIPDIPDYWTTDNTFLTPFFGKKMTRDQFLLIMSNLHLVDNEEATGSRLFKIQPFIDMCLKNFVRYEPQQKLAMDEATCPFKGKIVFRVYNPAKPNKFGIKLYQVCESSSGYCVTFDVYDGTAGVAVYSAQAGTNQTMGQTTKVVVGLLVKANLLDKGHIIYLDNYYNSPDLAMELDRHDTYICGTVRVNRQGMPRAFPQVKLDKNEAIFRRKGNMLVIKFHEKRDVHMISTCHNATYSVLNKRDRRTGDPVIKPTAVVDYCSNMGGVDLSDQMLQYYAALRRTVKWWRKLFFHLLNLVVLNAYKLFLKYGKPPSNRAHQKFRAKLVSALMESAIDAPVPSATPRRRGEPVDRMQGQHFPMYNIPGKESAKRKHPQRDCAACNVKPKDRNGHKRKQSVFMCDKCRVPLCVPECFKVYHTYKHYKRVLQEGSGSSSSDSD